MSEPVPLRLDAEAVSVDDELPAFLARPEGAKVYHGFPLIEETETEGWYYGAITEFLEPGGCVSGDGFVVAPDGTRAGLVWESGTGQFEEISAPEKERWGVYGVWFPKTIFTIDDLVVCFRAVLPQLQKRYQEIQDGL
jgi:hypothetical protein